MIRTYREFAIAMDLTEGGTGYPRRLRWSHPSTQNAQPLTWEDTRADTQAGYRDFNETGDFIIDGLQMRDQFMVYKEQATWVMQFVGGRYIHNFRPLFSTVGALTRNCIGEYRGNHIVLTLSDLVTHNGQEVSSLIERKWRKWLFSNIDTDYYTSCFLTINPQKSEVWVCFPESGSGPWCNKALIYNWQYGTYTVRELARAAYIGNGLVPFGQAGATTLTWGTITGSWGSSPLTWGERGFTNAEHNLLLCQAEADPTVSSSSTTTPKLLKLDVGTQFDGASYTSYLEREGLTIAGQDRAGNPVVDLQSFKYVRAVWPYVEANPGTTIGIQVGSQKDLTDAINWSSVQTFTVGTDRKVNCRVMGRYISVRFITTHSDDWYITGYDLDIDKMGRY
jgi:hypothetical protein